MWAYAPASQSAEMRPTYRAMSHKAGCYGTPGASHKTYIVLTPVDDGFSCASPRVLLLLTVSGMFACCPPESSAGGPICGKAMISNCTTHGWAGGRMQYFSHRSLTCRYIGITATQEWKQCMKNQFCIKLHIMFYFSFVSSDWTLSTDQPLWFPTPTLPCVSAHLPA